MRINGDPHRRSDRSEVQLNPKTFRPAMTTIAAQLLQLMLVVAMVVVVVFFDLCCWDHGQCRGAHHPGAQQ